MVFGCWIELLGLFFGLLLRLIEIEDPEEFATAVLVDVRSMDCVEVT